MGRGMVKMIAGRFDWGRMMKGGASFAINIAHNDGILEVMPSIYGGSIKI